MLRDNPSPARAAAPRSSVAVSFGSPAGDSGVTRLDLNDVLIQHPQAAFLIFHDVLQKRLSISPGQTIVCGMSLGYPDPDDKVNAFTPDRMAVEEFVTWVEELKRE